MQTTSLEDVTQFIKAFTDEKSFFGVCIEDSFLDIRFKNSIENLINLLIENKDIIIRPENLGCIKAIVHEIIQKEIDKIDLLDYESKAYGSLNFEYDRYVYKLFKNLVQGVDNELRKATASERHFAYMKNIGDSITRAIKNKKNISQ